MASTDDCRVLSIQSSVVSGYVGNKSATFPLQVLGFDVSTVNSVQFSNHTGYKVFKGQVLNAADMDDLYDGLKCNNIHHFTHLLTGYIGSKSFLEKVGEIIQNLRKQNPNLTYVCDPVMGDNGKMYVPTELLEVYKKVILPLADIVTPNQFEAELLTGVEIKTEADAWKAMQILHGMGPKTVVISSSDLGPDDTIVGLASSIKNGSTSMERYRIDMPFIDQTFVGTGDLFAACLLAWIQKDQNLKVALEKTVSIVQAVITRTVTHAHCLAGKGNKPTPEQMELRLVQSKADIEEPKIVFSAVPV
ncbi:pyridoxal kinase-like isoform X2 [Mizuhopecten yessoensis]|uniref:Pyridoxal kinase n=1 Tax=Mizuhopecten yessoensis TaxID=6573 RepID=A0A210QNA2_MIZYE|nr:pyridoxal kinase-like isoform X2 [Mizuhopecten yessoensis]OWF50214.1 Pyridoxal kinase [Mizuhopecten yessoensis]